MTQPGNAHHHKDDHAHIQGVHILRNRTGATVTQTLFLRAQSPVRLTLRLPLGGVIAVGEVGGGLPVQGASFELPPGASLYASGPVDVAVAALQEPSDAPAD